MKNRLVVTLTTVHGSRQYSLNQLTRYFIAALVLLAASSLFISNPLLLLTNDDLETLEGDHLQLSEHYKQILDSQQSYKTELGQLSESYKAELGQLSESYESELNQLSSSLSVLQTEKARLEAENTRVGQLNQSLDTSLLGLESLLGLPVSEDITQAQAEKLTVMANQRLFFLHSIPNGLPIKSERITDRFGTRIHPVHKKRRVHHGIDFKAKRGTPVYATADGAVEFSGYHKQSGYGNLIILQHNFGFKTYYGHLKTVHVKGRTFVRKGQLIGLSGNTGISTGPHLHYEVRYLYSPLDPEPFVDWNMTDFDSLFSKVKDVKWALLQKMYPLNQIKNSQGPPLLPREISSAAK
ncbi:MAG: peptidoglycan DD-metalloendopeptidase family protein [Pontibacterium sp.]